MPTPWLLRNWKKFRREAFWFPRQFNPDAATRRTSHYAKHVKVDRAGTEQQTTTLANRLPSCSVVPFVTKVLSTKQPKDLGLKAGSGIHDKPSQCLHQESFGLSFSRAVGSTATSTFPRIQTDDIWGVVCHPPDIPVPARPGLWISCRWLRGVVSPDVISATIIFDGRRRDLSSQWNRFSYSGPIPSRTRFHPGSQSTAN